MAIVWLLLLALTQSSIACQRDLHLRDDIEHKQDLPLIPRQLEPFPPQWSPNEKILHTSISTASIEAWSSYYTHGDHIAGRNKSMAEETARQWTANGVPSSLVEYEVFLNYPKEQALLLKRGNASIYQAQMYEDVLEEDETTGYPGAPPAFHGYSASGKEEAEYVYVGRGHKDDFAALKAANVSLTGKIALAKYGGPFRGVKVQNAEANGMIGVVIFTDPGDDGPQEAKGDAPYPKGSARQPSSIQRGSVAYINKYPGDPTTPGQPSKPGVKRVTPSNLPKIPSIPISYRDAIPILKALDGQGIPGKSINRGGWVGGLNATYSTGPAPGVTLSLTNIMEETITPIWNVIGIINGTNANETVIIGNHRDAWIIGGAADPNSGSAILVELTNAFGTLLKTGWKPRRNIIFASWDAEEYALIGSTEWVEDHAPWLSATAISYLNIDIGVSGPLPGSSSTPELRALALATMQKTVYAGHTLLDAWNTLNQFRPEDNGFGNLGSGSDYTAFMQLGISALDFGFDADRSTPVYHYHSSYDSFAWMKSRIDTDFSIHATAARFLALLAFRLADDALLPLDMADWARNVNYYVRDLVGATMGLGRDYGDVQQQINITELDEAAKRVRRVADEWVQRTGAEAFRRDESRVRRANGRMVEVLRLFVREGGLPGRAFYTNALVAPNRDDGYKAQTLPASMEALEDKKLDECRQWNLWIAERLNRAAELLVV